MKMINYTVRSPYFLRSPSKKKDFENSELFVEDEADEKEPRKKELILCRQCLQIITGPSEIIEVQGAHRHTFVNPQGILFEIGCFRSAKGCGYLGPATYEWSWFKGFKWRVAVCSRCLTHVGWLYISSGDKRFNGLILNRLISPNEWS